MDNLLCIHPKDGFRGSKFFEHPDTLRGAGIEPHIAVSDPPSDDITDILDEYPEEDVDAVMIRKVRVLDAVIEEELYEDTPLIFSGGLVIRRDRKEKWIKAVETGREIYLLTASVRAARSYYVSHDGNLQVIIAAMMGLSKDRRMETPLTRPEVKDYDIGFFSSQSYNKRPHRALETANAVAEDLGRTLRVWIGGMDWGDDYGEMMGEIAEGSYYDHIDIEHNDHINSIELFRKIQNTQVIYLPLMKPGEANCFAAWETVSYDVPLVGADWSSIGEATRQARHPLSATIPVKMVDSVEEVLPDFVQEDYPDVIDNNDPMLDNRELMIDEDEAQRALKHALTTVTSSYERTFEIPERLQTESTIAAISDLINNELTAEAVEGYVDAYASKEETIIESIDDDVLKTERGYWLLRNPFIYNNILHQNALP